MYPIVTKHGVLSVDVYLMIIPFLRSDFCDDLSAFQKNIYTVIVFVTDSVQYSL